MDRYIALLRGINVSGKNLIAMSELKKVLMNEDFINVRTYLNSGNIIFSSKSDDIEKLKNIIEKIINKHFNLNIPVYIISQINLATKLTFAPIWWNNSDPNIYDNLIFILPPLDYQTLFIDLGNPNDKFEKVFNHDDLVFWSFDLNNYRNTAWWSKTATTNLRNNITIRTARTILKLITM